MKIAVIIAIIIGVLFKLYDIIYGIDFLTDRNISKKDKIYTILIGIIIVVVLFTVTNLPLDF
jgi:hypothetical protein